MSCVGCRSPALRIELIRTVSIMSDGHRNRCEGKSADLPARAAVGGDVAKIERLIAEREQTGRQRERRKRGEDRGAGRGREGAQGERACPARQASRNDALRRRRRRAEEHGAITEQNLKHRPPSGTVQRQATSTLEARLPTTSERHRGEALHKESEGSGGCLQQREGRLNLSPELKKQLASNGNEEHPRCTYIHTPLPPHESESLPSFASGSSSSPPSVNCLGPGSFHPTGGPCSTSRIPNSPVRNCLLICTSEMSAVQHKRREKLCTKKSGFQNDGSRLYHCMRA